ncbi:MAG TPA: YEATS-associated helix-containing protein [Longimicrobium sp.]|jgi:hypothetical protein
MELRIAILLGVMALAGVLGGAINFTLIDADNPRRRWATSLLAGLGASFLVPLFLNTVKSTLVDNFLTSGDGTPTGNLLIIAGFCLVAAISSRAFIQTVSDRVLRLAEEANAKAGAANETAAAAHDQAERARSEAAETREAVEPLMASATEPAPQPRARAAAFAADATDATPQLRAVLDAFAASQYAFRTYEGLQGQTRLPAGELSEALEEMRRRGWAKTRTNSRGEMWYLTPDGRAAMLAGGRGAEPPPQVPDG